MNKLKTIIQGHFPESSEVESSFDYRGMMQVQTILETGL
jgi:hypothetical protein